MAGRPGRGAAAPPRGRRVSRLTLRILAINLFPVVILFAGLFHLDRYQDNLIRAELAVLSREAALFARAMGELATRRDVGGPVRLDVRAVHAMVQRASGVLRARARVFDIDGRPLVDSMAPGRPGGPVQVLPLPPPRAGDWASGLAGRVRDLIAGWPPPGAGLSRFHPWARRFAEAHPQAVRVLLGVHTAEAQTDGAGGLVLTAAAPIRGYKRVLGGLLLSAEGTGIEAAVRSARLEMLGVLAAAVLLSVALSLYLARAIARPIQALAAAAERVRRAGGRDNPVPDFRGRGDEIGDLSDSMREMTETLRRRMDAIEGFAADVAHEIKNPLTSVRSAVETAARVDDPARRAELFAIVLDDVDRLDRLIGDISEASRVDAQLSREDVGPVDVGRLLAALREAYIAAGRAPGGGLACEIDGAGPFVVNGNEDRLGQVVRNLLDNAVDFSPPDGRVAIRAGIAGGEVVIAVEDEGAGVPEGKLEAIFDRFYSERPRGEKFGAHSGLGLSICRQIVAAHGGRVRAGNRRSPAGATLGARFEVVLPRSAARPPGDGD